MKTKELDKVYNPKAVEEKWLRYWLETQLFRADVDSAKPVFSMVIPPPNVTGSLHMGHALNNTLQDILARYKRMNGFDVLWVPGTDHAGIATQNVVEKKLHAEKLDRHKLGREKFIELVWQWKEESGGAIINQLKRLGASCDWSREQFTMSPELSKAVREVFVRLYEEGLIYRDERLINWCPRCLTALSDIEVEHEEAAGKLYHIRYPIADAGTDLKSVPGFLTVATTRPETMFGDTAVAVHPDDERYNKFIGKEVLLPLTNRKIPVIGDSILVDLEFGTGAVKITPAHDFNDFEAGLRHRLKRIAIFNERAHIKPNIPDVADEVMKEIADLHAHKAKEKVIHILKERGALTKTEDHRHAIGKCYRCKTVIEPYLSPQWYVKVESLAKEAIKAVEQGRTRIIPEGWENTYFEWMRNIKDWCVSRQIWWGHQIPAWYCLKCNKDEIYEIQKSEAKSLPLNASIRGQKPEQEKGQKLYIERFVSVKARPIVSRDEPTTCPSCGGSHIIRDNDVLDTWFSSALWPFSTLGWPEKTKELKHYYPTAALITGFDIIFFWVARMLMMGLKFMNDVPFRDVYIHALVRDAEGQKMSKSKGNVIDPLVIMDKYGTDAFRFTLAAMAAQGRDVKLAEERIEGYRNFCNKIWNLARFTLMNIEEPGVRSQKSEVKDAYSLADKWILTRLNAAIKETTSALENYRFNDAANSAYQFIWHELCDWYVELIKLDLRGENGEERKHTAQDVLLTVLRDLLKLLHPIIPFITEEVWDVLSVAEEGSRVKGQGAEAGWAAPTSIMRQAFPQTGEDYPDAERDMLTITDVIKALRNIRSEMNVSPAIQIEAICRCSDNSTARLLAIGEQYIKGLAKVSVLKISASAEKPKDAATAITGNIEIFVPLKGLINFDDERKRVAKDMEKIIKEIEAVQKRLSSADFIERAPKAVVEKDRIRLEELSYKKIKLEQGLEKMEER
ncbi:MAG: valine--tRNA ligase [Deltaproteobacteria bacterium]|nr:valine--tRNA ligase [Deltaproteobacteria bacterium]